MEIRYVVRLFELFIFVKNLSSDKVIALACGFCGLAVQISVLKIIKSIAGACFSQEKAKLSRYIKSKGLKTIGPFKLN